MTSKSLTLRIPSEVYAQVVSRRRKSTSAYIVEAVKEKLARDRRQELRESFENLVPVDMDEVEPWMQAQREAMRRIDD